MSSGSQKFPSPIGGVPFPHDFAPSLLFAVIYALTVPLAAYRMISKSSRSLVLIGTSIFTLERVIDFAIRAVEAEKPNLRTTSFYVSWLQSAYALGFVSITQDLGHIARIFVLNVTKSSNGSSSTDISAGRDEEQPFRELPRANDSSSALPKWKAQAVGGVIAAQQPGVWIGRLGKVSLIMRLTSIVLGAVYGGVYFQGINNQSMATVAQATRYASTVIVLNLQLLILAEICWALVTHPARTPRKPALYLCAMCGVNMITTIYRLVAMDNYATSLLSTAPGSLNGPTAKALFYTFHIAPEWLAGAMLLSINVREMYGIGASLQSGLRLPKLWK